MDKADVVACFRHAAELVTDPALHKYKYANVGLLSSAAHDVLRRKCRDHLDRIWACVSDKYGIQRDRPFCAVYSANTPMCLLALTTDACEALRTACAWLRVCDTSLSTNVFSPVNKVDIAVVTTTAATVFTVGKAGKLENKRTEIGSPERFVVMAAAMAYTAAA